MLQSATKIPIHVFYIVVIICIILLTASCREPATPTLEQSPSSTAQEQAIETPASKLKISLGQHLRFETISLEEGLSQSTVFCMLQDRQGFMWFGTEDGLNKYDGYNFTVFKHDPEDPNNLSYTYIQAMIEDRSGMLWFGTSEGGLLRYDIQQDQFTHYRNDPEDPSSLSDNEITALFQDRDGTLWIGTGGGGLERFDQENESFTHYQHNPDDSNSLSSNAVFAIYEDQRGTLWIGTEGGGLNRLVLSKVEGLEREDDHWSHFLNDPNPSHSLKHEKITTVSEDPSGVLWIGTDGGGLDKFDPESEQFIHYQHDPNDPGSLSSDKVMVIFRDQDGVIWIGTYGGGINRYDQDKDNFSHYKNFPGDPHSISSDAVMSIFQDRESVLWFGTIGGGVNKLDMGLTNFALYQNEPDNPNSLGDNMVRAFYEENNDDLWIGSMFGGIDRFIRETGDWHHYRHDPNDPGSLSNDFVSVIYKDRSGMLWIGTASGLDQYNPETKTFSHYQAEPDDTSGSPRNNVRTIYEVQTGEFWIGTKGGLYQFNPEKGSWGQYYSHNPGDPDSLSNDWVFKFIEDHQGRFWIGTLGGGLNRFDPTKETFTRYQHDPADPNSVSNDIVTGIFQDQRGALWLSTAGGLDRFNPETETFTHFREEDGMANNSIYCTLEDGDGYLWVSTNKGLSRFDPQSETFRNYDVTDGLQSNEFNSNACLMSDNGKMFLGGINGFNAFFPDQIRDNPTVPPVVLTSLAQNGEEVDLGMAVDRATEVTFKWPDNAFEFEFAALSYTQPEENQYAYYLEGFEETWNEVGIRRYGQYTNIPGGTYTLRVKGSNNDGVWNEVGTELKITIVPPFWATWWFQGFALMVLLGGVYGGYRLRVRNLEARGRELESLVEQRTSDLIETQETLRQKEMEKAITEERSRLARELHDSVTQSLHSSTLMAEAGQRLAGAGDIGRARGYLIRLGEISQQALREMRLLVYELRPLALKEFGLVGALQQRLDAVERRSGVEVQLSIEEELELPERIEEELFRVAMEALNNASKHANLTRVTVSIQKKDKHDIPCIELAIVDNGIGFDPESRDDEGGLGLISMRERIDKLGGELTIISAPDEGTQVKACVNLETPSLSPDAEEV